MKFCFETNKERPGVVDANEARSGEIMRRRMNLLIILGNYNKEYIYPFN